MKIFVKERIFKEVCGSLSRARRLYYSGRSASSNYFNIMFGLICESSLADFFDVPYMCDVENIMAYDFIAPNGLTVDVKSFSIYDMKYADKLNFIVEKQNCDNAGADLYAFCVYEIRSNTVHYVSIMPVNAFKGLASEFKEGESIKESYAPLSRDCYVLPYSEAVKVAPLVPHSGKQAKDEYGDGDSNDPPAHES